jgi:hypothetical protein
VDSPAYRLKSTWGLQEGGGSSWTNQFGGGPWVLGTGGAWYFILPSGAFYQRS